MCILNLSIFLAVISNLETEHEYSSKKCWIFKVFHTLFIYWKMRDNFVSRDNFGPYCIYISILYRVGHPFFSKERSVLSVLFRSFKKNGTFFPFFSILFKRTEHSFRYFPFFTKECSILFRSFKKNGTFFLCSFPNLTNLT